MLAECAAEDAAVRTEQIRQTIASTPVCVASTPLPIRVSMSFGLAERIRAARVRRSSSAARTSLSTGQKQTDETACAWRSSRATSPSPGRRREARRARATVRARGPPLR